MSGLAKTFTILILFLSVCFFATTATLFKTRRNWRAEYGKYSSQAEERLADLTKALKETTDQNDDKDDEIGKLKSHGEQRALKLEKGQSDNTALRAQLASAQSSRKESEALANRLSANLESTGMRLKERDEKLDEASSRLNTSLDDSDLARKERDAMRLSLVRSNELLHDSRAEYKSLSEKHEALALQIDAIKAKHPGIDITGVIGAPFIDALVSAVDGNEGLALISAGRDQLVEVGHKFTVSRGSSFIATLEVIRVYPDLAGARILLTSEGEQVRQGDKVFTSY